MPSLFLDMNKISQSGNKSKVNTFVQLVIFVGLGVFFIWLSLHSLSKEDVRMIYQSMAVINNPYSWCMLCLTAIAAIMADVARAERMRIQLQSMGHNVRRSMAFHSVMVCYLANLALPRLGEVLRCTFLQRFERVPFQKSLGAVLTERAVDVLCWAVMFLVAIAMNTGMLNQLVIDDNTNMTIGMWMETKGLSVLGNYFIYILLAFIALIVLVGYLTRKWWMKSKLMMKVWDFILGIWQGFISIKNLPKPGLYVLWTALMWVFYLLGNLLCLYAFPFLNGAGVGAAFTVLTFSTIAFMVSQAGLGSYPLIVAGILMIYGADYTQGLAAGWIGWILQQVVVLVLGFASLILASFYKKPAEMVPSEDLVKE